ncbi:LURP-one-related/scramblase family protein [Prosthecobacter vanneervenii]|uniref:Uncharacterized protein n=1 Tax=Prosthecobacter vanneervenii TaxID=48466 RepID=A0A7W7YC91_9BACT|nr:hypothetical protein [Prosthecobacter vanneervenii]MBB5033541.1 hypothetical protein [Prosthecobacter vanneervenii]
MYYPLNFRFKLMTFTPEIDVTDAYGGTICHVRQQFFRLREKVDVYADDSERTLLATIEADRVIDWSARYTFRAPDGRELGAVGRQGMRSLWRAHYDVYAPGAETPTFVIQESNPFVKLLDGLVGEIPILGMFTGYMLHPSYIATRGEGGPPVLKLTKKPALLEGRFALTQEGPANEGEQLALLLSFLMMNLLEKNRG